MGLWEAIVPDQKEVGRGGSRLTRELGSVFAGCRVLVPALGYLLP